jgi:hypothetical protein
VLLVLDLAAGAEASHALRASAPAARQGLAQSLESSEAKPPPASASETFAALLFLNAAAA